MFGKPVLAALLHPPAFISPILRCAHKVAALAYEFRERAEPPTKPGAGRGAGAGGGGGGDDDDGWFPRPAAADDDDDGAVGPLMAVAAEPFLDWLLGVLPGAPLAPDAAEEAVPEREWWEVRVLPPPPPDGGGGVGVGGPSPPPPRAGGGGRPRAGGGGSSP